MSKKCVSSILLWCFLWMSASGAGAEGLDAGYFAGNWELNVDGKCGQEDAEFIHVRANGTFDYGRRGKVESVGFWRIDGDVVMLEMLTSPAYFEDIANELKDYHGLYGYYPVRAMTFDIQKDRFGAVASIGSLMSKFTAHRCSRDGKN